MKSLAGAGTLLVALVVSGCTGDPEPQFAPEPSPSPSAPATSAEPEPEAWEEKTPEGAVAFAKHWTATFSEAFQTGDTQEFEALGGPGCETCSDLVALIRDTYDRGGRIDGDSWSLREPSYSATDGNNDEVTVSGIMRIPVQRFVMPGESTVESEATSNRFTFVLSFAGETWSATRVTREA